MKELLKLAYDLDINDFFDYYLKGKDTRTLDEEILLFKILEDNIYAHSEKLYSTSDEMFQKVIFGLINRINQLENLNDSVELVLKFIKYIGTISLEYSEHLNKILKNIVVKNEIEYSKVENILGNSTVDLIKTDILFYLKDSENRNLDALIEEVLSEYKTRSLKDEDFETKLEFLHNENVSLDSKEMYDKIKYLTDRLNPLVEKGELRYFIFISYSLESHLIRSNLRSYSFEFREHRVPSFRLVSFKNIKRLKKLFYLNNVFLGCRNTYYFKDNKTFMKFILCVLKKPEDFESKKFPKDEVNYHTQYFRKHFSEFESEELRKYFEETHKVYKII